MNANTHDDSSASPAVDFGLALRRAQHVLGQRIDEVLGPLDLNLGTWRVLREVARQPGASASELARASFHTPQTLSGLLRRLEDRGLVERSEARGRVVDNHLTPAGHDVLTTSTQRAEEVITAALMTFAPDERADFVRMTANFTNTLAHHHQRSLPTRGDTWRPGPEEATPGSR